MKLVSLFFILLSLPAYGMENQEHNNPSPTKSSPENLLKQVQSFSAIITRPNQCQLRNSSPVLQPEPYDDSWTPFSGIPEETWSFKYTKHQDKSVIPVKLDPEDVALFNFLCLSAPNAPGKN